MGRRNTQGAVSIDKDKNTIRLRWRYQSKRYSLNLFLYNKANLLRTKKLALTIEHDLVSGAFDSTLNIFNTLHTKLSLKADGYHDISAVDMNILAITRYNHQNR